MSNRKLPKSSNKITPGFAFSLLRRSLREGFANRQFGKEEMNQVLTFFEQFSPECVFCGSTDVKRWDHLVPVKQGGDTVLGNMVPSCAACDDSKQDRRYDEWMLSDAPKSPRSRNVEDIPQRIQHIDAYLMDSSHGFVVRILEYHRENVATYRVDDVSLRVRMRQ